MRDELIRRFTNFGTRTAILDQADGFTYQELLERIRYTQDVLEKHGVAPHDVVVVNGNYSLGSIATLLALFLNRNVVVPLVTLSERDLDTVTEHCRPRFLVTPDGAELGVEELAAPSSGPAAMIGRLSDEKAAGLVLLSSGSTGAPKVILHSLDALVGEKLEKRPRRSETPLNILMVLMFDHIGGINSLLSALLVGSTAVLPRERTPEEICRLIERHGIRVLPASPTFLNLILMGDYRRTYDLSSLRLVTYGTEPMSDELLKRVNRNFPGVRLLQTFGTSETGIATTTSESSSSTYFKISDAHVEYRIVDGELQLKSRTQFLGYLNYRDDSLTEDHWFRTGDLVEETADGYLRIRGRAKEVINVGGEKLLPLELESVLLSSPLIEDCVVYGRPNAITGQIVCVDIKPLGEPNRAALRKHVLEFLADKVEPFKIPSKISVVDSVGMSERLKKVRSSSRPGKT
ncbi:long-chain fatty acid--CoA ligase [Streptomyces sp. RKND-216]|uniref:class I adenylate-forming enzyme family protein n=1 Tax=Streptomyces sp. RKND-216 TaxID=2562581 RepID=UPI00109D90C4|nr:fatty acid--CoA ligase family protein [Streptomyces sp. RKND-216]THA24784.1 long-chain fatty acid--CoA ligase [Streptomyces sp. RKND-216]